MGMDGGHFKTCRNCGITKPLESYYSHPTCVDGHIGVCKECKKFYARDYSRTHREQDNARKRERMSDPRVRASRNARSAERRRERRKASLALLPPKRIYCGRQEKHPLYGRYAAMLRRCYNKNVQAYPWYGARGVRVCERWRNSFAAFLEDMGMPDTPAMQIDRINNDGDYAPNNCRWVTRSSNCLNRRPKGSQNHVS